MNYELVEVVAKAAGWVAVRCDSDFAYAIHTSPPTSLVGVPVVLQEPGVIPEDYKMTKYWVIPDYTRPMYHEEFLHDCLRRLTDDEWDVFTTALSGIIEDRLGGEPVRSQGHAVKLLLFADQKHLCRAFVVAKGQPRPSSTSPL